MARKKKEDTASVMLAPNKVIPFDSPYIPYPNVYASTKFDGNRCFVRGKDLLTRSMIQQPNPKLVPFMQPLAKYADEHGLCFDCELLIPNATHHGIHGSVFNSSVNAKDIPKNTQVHVFDVFSIAEWVNGEITSPLCERYPRYTKHLKKIGHPNFFAVPQIEVSTPKRAEELFKQAIGLGHEGIMLRNAMGYYKPGRCGHKGAWLLKFKAVETHDGEIIEVLQQLQMKEGIARERNEFGRLVSPTKNSDNYELAESCAGFRVRMEDGTEGEVCFGEGVANMEERGRLWKARKSLIGRWVEFVAYPGAKDSIRSGRMIKWRPDKEARSGKPTTARKSRSAR